MKYYDFKKAKQIIEENKNEIVSASLGMHEDWFWTANTVFENGEYSVVLFEGDIIEEEQKYFEERKNGLSLFDGKYDHIMIAGLCSSRWATPTLQLRYPDDSDKMIPCYLQKGEDIPLADKLSLQMDWTSGYLSSKVQENITPLSNQ